MSTAPIVRHAEDTTVSGVVSTQRSLHISSVPDMTVRLRKDKAIKDATPRFLAASSPEEAQKFVLPPCPQFPSNEFLPVETFVKNAIAAPDSSKEYRVMLESIRKPKDPLTLCKVLLALRGTTLYQITGNPTTHARLLHVLFRLDPFLKEKQEKLPDLYSLADAHLHLMVALVSANSVFLESGMTALWRLLTTTPSSSGGEKMERTSRLHAALATMLRLVPKGNSELFPIVASNFPFRTRPRPELEWYTLQCLTILEYVPTLHSQVLELLLDKCLEMDVEIKISDGGGVSIDKQSRHSDNAEQEMFELELDDSKQPAMQQDHAEKKVDEMADKVSIYDCAGLLPLCCDPSFE